MQNNTASFCLGEKTNTKLGHLHEKDKHLGCDNLISKKLIITKLRPSQVPTAPS